MISESSIIKSLKIAFPEFIGDDGAVIDGCGNQKYIITKDILVEDIHFRTKYFSPSDLAHKMLHVNLSDIAAMGAAPKFIMCGIGIPEKYSSYVDELLIEFIAACKTANVILIGGDTTKAPDKFTISITAIGECYPKNIKYRNKAEIGDVVCVAGDLGHAHLGFVACEKSISGYSRYKNAFLRPAAKTKEGVWLGSCQFITSMMDVSDGLFIDLQRLLEASNVSGVIDVEKLKFDDAFKDACNIFSLDPLEIYLTGGEDYGLLFTVKSEYYKVLAANILLDLES
jgi:thiamine-monophosphate kinase